jgi:predicted HD phosphohydrolase
VSMTASLLSQPPRSHRCRWPRDVTRIRAELRNHLVAARTVPHDGRSDELQHALLTAGLAVGAGAEPTLVAAALLHGVGRVPAIARMYAGLPHERAAAAYCARELGWSVAQLVGAHVAAKRALLATDPDYVDSLSAASVASLAGQGGPMTRAELDAFLEQPYAAAALMLRRWDDAARQAANAEPGSGRFAGVVALDLDDALDIAVRAVEQPLRTEADGG